MQYVSKREKLIIQVFVKQIDKVINSHELADKLNVSTRTIKSDIKDLNTILEKYGAEIISVVSKGYRLIVYKKDLFQQLIVDLKINDSDVCDRNVAFYRYERVIYIIKKMLAIDYYVSIDDLADELCVSNSTVATDLVDVKKQLSRYSIKVVGKPKYGLILEGNELNNRLCIADFFFHSNVETGFLASDHAMFVSQASKQEVRNIGNVLKETINLYNIKLSDSSFQNIVIHTVITIRRWKFYNYIKFETANSDRVKSFSEYPAGEYYIKKIEKMFNMILPDDESLYFTLHFHCKNLKMECDYNNYEKRIKHSLDLINKMMIKKYSLNIDAGGGVI